MTKVYTVQGCNILVLRYISWHDPCNYISNFNNGENVKTTKQVIKAMTRILKNTPTIDVTDKVNKYISRNKKELQAWHLTYIETIKSGAERELELELNWLH